MCWKYRRTRRGVCCGGTVDRKVWGQMEDKDSMGEESNVVVKGLIQREG